MTQAQQDAVNAKPPFLAQSSAEALEQLNAIFAAYNDTTSRMQRSYELLQQEVLRLRQELEVKNEQLQRKSRLAALGEMAAGMAHEIRNPLGAVQLYTSILERDLEHVPESLQWVRKISRGVRSLDQIVNDILAFTNDQTCDKAPVNLYGLLQEVLDYVQPQLLATQITVDMSAVDKQLQVDADVNQLRRVFLNLLLNSIEAIKGRGTVRLTAGDYGLEPPYRVKITISDTGDGIPGKIIKKIFNPFFTTKDTGTGLGLAIVHRLIDCHGGVISAANNRGAPGAVFTIMLP